MLTNFHNENVQILIIVIFLKCIYSNSACSKLHQPPLSISKKNVFLKKISQLTTKVSSDNFHITFSNIEKKNRNVQTLGTADVIKV